MSTYKYPPEYQLKNSNRRPRKPQKNDVALLGLIVGLAFPALAILLLYFFRSGAAPFSAYMNMFIRFGEPRIMNEVSKLISLSMIANLIPFYYFLNRKAYLSTKGVIIATALLGVLMVLYKFVWG